MSIPSSDFTELIYTLRNNVVESRMFGVAVVTDPDGHIVAQLGDGQAPVIGRSALKPFQAIACLRTGAQLEQQQVAVVAGSHRGSAAHQDVVGQILANHGLDEDALQCPTSLPASRAEVARLAAESAPVKLTPTKLAHPCSGKHAGFLAAAKACGAPLGTYLDSGHPVQEEALRVVEQYCDTTVEHVVADGCSAPTAVVSLASLARGFGRLGAGINRRDAELNAVRVTTAMLDEPAMVESSGGFDTVMLEELGVIAKTGAEGVLGLGTSDGYGVGIKMISGSIRGAHVVGLALLAQFSAALPTSQLLHPVFKTLAPPVVAGGQPVGSLKLGAAVLQVLS